MSLGCALTFPGSATSQEVFAVYQPLMLKPKYVSKSRAIDRLRSTFVQYIDRLWYEGCLKTIQASDV
jgi:hypothetical protein